MTQSTVHQVMTRDVVVAHRGTAFKEIIGLFHRNDISAVPVVDEENVPIGIVTEADLIARQAGPPGRRRLVPRLHRPADPDEPGTAEELMTSPVVTAEPGWTLTEAARVMHRKRLKRLPVVDAGGGLVGIVSRCDLLEPFLRPDAEIRREITEEILGQGLGLAPHAVEAEVADGAVTLTGEVEHSSTVPVLERLCRAVPGVVALHTRVGHRIDDTTPGSGGPLARAVLGPDARPRR